MVPDWILPRSTGRDWSVQEQACRRTLREVARHLAMVPRAVSQSQTLPFVQRAAEELAAELEREGLAELQGRALELAGRVSRWATETPTDADRWAAVDDLVKLTKDAGAAMGRK